MSLTEKTNHASATNISVRALCGSIASHTRFSTNTQARKYRHEMLKLRMGF